MFRPKDETKVLLLSVTKTCETLIKQSNTKPQETFEFKLTKQKELFSFYLCNNLGLDSSWMIGSTILDA